MKIDEIKEMVEVLEEDEENIGKAIDAYNDISWQYITEPHNVLAEMERVLLDIQVRLEEINTRLEAI